MKPFKKKIDDSGNVHYNVSGYWSNSYILVCKPRLKSKSDASITTSLGGEDGSLSESSATRNYAIALLDACDELDRINGVWECEG